LTKKSNLKPQRNDNIHYQIELKPGLSLWALLVPVKKGKTLCFQQGLSYFFSHLFFDSAIHFNTY